MGEEKGALSAPGQLAAFYLLIKQVARTEGLSGCGGKGPK